VNLRGKLLPDPKRINASGAMEPDWESDLFLTVVIGVILLAIFLVFGR
jgi:hypothetical protein